MEGQRSPPETSAESSTVASTGLPSDLERYREQQRERHRQLMKVRQQEEEEASKRQRELDDEVLARRLQEEEEEERKHLDAAWLEDDEALSRRLQEEFDREGRPAGGDDDVRPPDRTGYTERLIDPEDSYNVYYRHNNFAQGTAAGPGGLLTAGGPGLRDPGNDQVALGPCRCSRKTLLVVVCLTSAVLLLYSVGTLFATSSLPVDNPPDAFLS